MSDTSTIIAATVVWYFASAAVVYFAFWMGWFWAKPDTFKVKAVFCLLWPVTIAAFAWAAIRFYWHGKNP